MNVNFDVNKVFQERLASSMGLDKYQYIMDQVKKTNICMDVNFQRTFNGFYIVRRNEAKECIEAFDRLLPDYKCLSNMKKIDSILWSIR